MINEKRLLDEFLELVKVDSPSKKEGKITKVLKKKLEKLGAKVFLDESGKNFGSNGSNIIAKFRGKSGTPIMLNAHMDTVTPGEGIKPIVEDGVIKSDGKTILGADCKSGIAIILEVMRNLRNPPPIDVVFTLSEEIGLLGAKNLDFFILDAKYGYALDSEKIETVVTQAPSHNKFFVKIYGKESHAGAKPENGISAIEVLSKGILRIKLGKIDEKTTANIGVIKGGEATNIIPGYAEAKGEVRSHDEEKLEKKTKEIIKVFKNTNKEYSKEIEGRVLSPKMEEEILREYNSFHISENEEILKRALQEGKNLGLSMKTAKGGGGSDANIFNEKGIKTVVLGTGMQKVHTKEEFIRIQDMMLSSKLLINLIAIKEQTSLQSFN